MNKLDKVLYVLKTVEVTEICDEKVMIDFESGKYLLLKGVGNTIWEMIHDGVRVSEIVEGLLRDYEVTRNECEQLTIEFLEKLVEFGFIALK